MAGKSWSEIANECIDLVKRLGAEVRADRLTVDDDDLEGDLRRVSADLLH